MRAYVIGGDGMVGKALVNYLNTLEQEVIYTSRKKNAGSEPQHRFLDLKNPDLTFERIPNSDHPDVIYIVAAVTKVVDCEADPQSTWQVNADGPVSIALQAKRINAHVVFISSDAVERAPNLNYSRQKAYVEGIVLANGGTVIRPNRIPPDKVNRLLEDLFTFGLNKVSGMYKCDL